MKKLLLSLFIAVGLCFSTQAQIVDFTLQDSDLNSHTLFNYLSGDKVVVLNFWAQTQPESASFAPTLQGIYVDYGSNAGDVIVLSIEISQKSYTAINTWKATNSVTYPAIGGDQGPPSGNGYLAYDYWNSQWSPTIGLSPPQVVVLHPNPSNPASSTAAFGSTVTPGSDTQIRAAIDGYVGIQSQNLVDGQISIFPNPATDYVNVQFAYQNSEEVNLSVFNIIGEQINLPITTTLNNGVNSTLINTSALVNGYYMVQLRTETATKTMRLQIIK